MIHRFSFVTLMLVALLSLTHLSAGRTFANGIYHDTFSRMSFSPDYFTLQVGQTQVVKVTAGYPASAFLRHPQYVQTKARMTAGSRNADVGNASVPVPDFVAPNTWNLIVVGCRAPGKVDILVHIVYPTAGGTLWFEGHLIYYCVEHAPQAGLPKQPDVGVRVATGGTLVHQQGHCVNLPHSYNTIYTFWYVDHRGFLSHQPLIATGPRGLQLYGSMDNHGNFHVAGPNPNQPTTKMQGRMDSHGNGSAEQDYRLNDGNCLAKYELHLRAMGIADPGASTNPSYTKVAVTPSTLDFTAPVGSPSPFKKVTITNTGNSTVIVDAVNTANFGEFDFSPKCLQVTLAPGASCTMSMRFWPTQAGPVTGWLTIRAGTKNYIVRVRGYATGE